MLPSDRTVIEYVSNQFAAALGFQPGIYILAPGEMPDPSWVQPVASVLGGRTDGQQVRVDGPLTTQQIATLTTLWDGMTLSARTTRLIVDLFNAFAALTTAQKTNVGNWMIGTGARPHRWELWTGPNANSIALIVLIRGGEAGLSVTDKEGMAALMAQDQPDLFFNNAVIDATIAIQGDAPSS